MMADMMPVTSSNIAAIGFDVSEPDEDEPIVGTLHVQFNNGRTYTYDDVQTDVYEALRSAKSVGRYFQDHVRHAGYVCTQL